MLGCALGYAVRETRILQHRDPQFRANVFILCETSKGTWAGEGGNLITDLGEGYVRNIMGFDNETNHNATKWISLSNVGSPSASWTQLDTEVNANGFTRNIGTVVSWANGTDHAFNVSYKFTATGSQQLQTAGAQYNDTPVSDNNLFAVATFDQTTFASGDNLTITWVFTWDCN